MTDPLLKLMDTVIGIGVSIAMRDNIFVSLLPDEAKNHDTMPSISQRALTARSFAALASITNAATATSAPFTLSPTGAILSGASIDGTSTRLLVNSAGTYKVYVQTPFLTANDTYAVYVTNASLAGFTLNLPGDMAFRGTVTLAAGDYLSVVNMNASSLTPTSTSFYLELEKIN